VGVIGQKHTHTHTNTNTHTHTQHEHTDAYTRDFRQTEDGRTALHHAVSKGHKGVVEALLKSGCNTEIQDTV
jgi:ankyrin repeat protein